MEYSDVNIKNSVAGRSDWVSVMVGGTVWIIFLTGDRFFLKKIHYVVTFGCEIRISFTHGWVLTEFTYRYLRTNFIHDFAIIFLASKCPFVIYPSGTCQMMLIATHLAQWRRMAPMNFVILDSGNGSQSVLHHERTKFSKIQTKTKCIWICLQISVLFRA